MKIYIAHSRGFNYQEELYSPIRISNLNTEHTFFLPHEKSDKPFSSIDFFKNEADLVIAEVSYPATGLGIELGWANIVETPIICIYKKGKKISGSLISVTDKFIEYEDTQNLIEKISDVIDNF